MPSLNTDIHVGAVLVSGSGQEALVLAVNTEGSGEATLDFNHNLAGKRLRFDLRLVACTPSLDES